jgi:outer membrane protein assembly factor BamB
MDGAPAPKRVTTEPTRLDVAIFGLIVAGLVLLAWWMAQPWLKGAPGGAALDAYLPLGHAMSALSVELNAHDQPIAWLSENTVQLPATAALAGAAPKSIIDTMTAAYPDALQTGEVPGADLFATTIRRVDTAGAATTLRSYLLRGPDGDKFLGVEALDNDLVLAYAPPMPRAPTDVAPGNQWGATGLLNGNITYGMSATVAASGMVTGVAGIWPDCLLVESRTAYTDSAATFLTADHDRSWACRDVGLVETTLFSPTGELASRRLLLADTSAHRPGAMEYLPPRPAITATVEQPLGAASSWVLSRQARARPIGSNTFATFAPVYVPTDPPLLLVAAQGGPLVALEVDAPGVSRWQFEPGGPIFGSPTVDPVRGLIYFGSAAKRLYAVDFNGLFRWAVATRDNVAAQPLLAGDFLVATAEDGQVFAVDPLTGAPRWQYDAGSQAISWLSGFRKEPKGPKGNIVSSPALVPSADGELVVFGSDQGAVVALALASGAPRWQFDAGAAVEAPVVYRDGTLYVVTQDGDVFAIDGQSGAQQWRGDAGEAVRMAPAVTPDLVLVVNDAGQLRALDRLSGETRWVSAENDIVGAPLVVETTDMPIVVVTHSGGALSAYSLDGERLQQWDSALARLPTDDALLGYDLGPTRGGGSLWSADSTGVIRRLGPPVAEEAAIVEIAWLDQATEPPFSWGFFDTSAIPFPGDDGAALVIDQNGALFRLEAATGAAQFITKLSVAEPPARIDPVVIGELLLLVTGDTLTAYDRASWTPRWQTTGLPLSLFPLAVQGDTVLWLSSDPADEDAAAPLLQAIGLEAGELRWQYTLPATPYSAGFAATGDVVFTGSPTVLLDLATGEERWQLDAAGVGVPVIDHASETVFVALAQPRGMQADIVALNLADGGERWRTPLANHLPHPFDRLALSGSVVVVPTAGNTILGLDAATGALRWELAAPGPRFGTLTVGDGALWSFLQDGRMLWADAESGATIALSSVLDFDLSSASYLQHPLVLEPHIVMPAGWSIFGFTQHQ